MILTSIAKYAESVNVDIPVWYILYMQFVQIIITNVPSITVNQQTITFQTYEVMKVKCFATYNF